MVYMASIVGRSTRSSGFHAGWVRSPGGRWVMPVSMASSGFSDETDQSLPPDTTAPLRTTLLIGYNQRERVGPSVGAVPGSAIGERIQRHPDRPVADGVHVDLKSLAVELHCQILERRRIINWRSGVSFAIEIGSQKRRGAGFNDAVGKELYRQRSDPRAGEPGTQLLELGKQA